MIPSDIKPDYLLYKRLSDAVAQWLVHTAISRGYDIRDLNEYREPGERNFSIPPAVFPSLAIHIVREQDPPATIPPYIIRTINDIIHLRQLVRNQLASKGWELDTGHLHPIQMMQQTRDALGPLSNVSSESRLGGKSTPHDILVNSFEALRVEETTNGSSGIESPKREKTASKREKTIANFQTRMVDDVAEAHLAVTGLLAKSAEVRAIVDGLWHKYGSNEVDLTTVAAITNMAIRVIRSEEETTDTLIDRHGGWIKLLATVDTADYQCCDPMLRTRHQLEHLVELARNHDLKSGHPSWASMQVFPTQADESKPNENIGAASVVANILPELLLISRNEETRDTYDEVTNGLCRAIRGDKLSFWLVAAVEILDAIVRKLGDSTTDCQTELSNISNQMLNSIDGIMDLQTTVRSPKWPQEADEGLVQLRNQIRQKGIDDFVQKSSKKRKWKVKKFSFQHSQPLYCGVILLSLRTQFHVISLEFVNHWGTTIRAAHLYRACKETFLISSRWKTMEAVFETQPHSAIFIGEEEEHDGGQYRTGQTGPSPQMRRLRHYNLLTGASPTVWASNRRAGTSPAAAIPSERVKKFRDNTSTSQYLSKQFPPQSGDAFSGLELDSICAASPEKTISTSRLHDILKHVEDRLDKEARSLDIDYLALHRETFDGFKAFKQRHGSMLLSRSPFPNYLQNDHEVSNMA